MSLDEAPGESKTQTSAVDVPGCIADLAELLEGTRMVGGGDPDAVVAHSEQISVSCRVALTQIEPSVGVYLMALDSRL